MRHTVKTQIFKLLEKLPKPVGNRFYHLLQSIKEKPVLREYEFQLQTINRFNTLLQNLNLTFYEKIIIEVGSGWLPILPYELLYQHHSREIWTFDINKHYQKSKINKFNRFYSKEKAFDYFEDLPPAVRYFPNTNILDFDFMSNSADVLISRNVLEHVLPNDIYDIHRQAYSYLRNDSFIIHQISPSDHRSYTDSSLSLWDFLQYSAEEWNQVQTRFDYHNRLRLPQYLQIFESCGFKPMHVTYKSAKPNQKLPPKVHSDFQNFSIEELTAGSILIVLKKK
ncbi:MAG: hypothetical protein J0L67_02285 [Cytophagales bacterium]|nr:hypothetical protein [Cytophagales bacterium]